MPRKKTTTTKTAHVSIDSEEYIFHRIFKKLTLEATLSVSHGDLSFVTGKTVAIGLCL